LIAVSLIREPERAAVCTGFSNKLDGVWDASERVRLEVAFLGSRVPYAIDAMTRVEEALDARAQQWVALRTDVCRGTRLRGDQSEELLDLRTQCLDERLAEMKALVESFATADRRVVQKSVIAVGDLSDLELCTNARYVRQSFRPPRNASERAQVDALYGDLAKANALEITGRYKDALAVTQSLEQAARALGYKPLEAQALLRLGGLSSQTGDPTASERQLFDAAIAAEAGGIDEVAARAWIKLGDLVGDDLARAAR
jgi:eukaryotic-like serine/threonine-protein kinase